MPKLLDNKTINGSLNKIVETSNGLIVNGSYMSKADYFVKPFQLFDTDGGFTDLGMNKRMTLGLTGTYGDNKSENMVVVDKDDPTINYILSDNSRGNKFKMLKIREIPATNSVSLINSITTTVGGPSHNFLKYAGQNDRFLFYLGERQSGYAYTNMHKIDKATLVPTTLSLSVAYTTNKVLKETDTHIFFALYSGGANQMTYYMFEKSTEVFTVMNTDTAANRTVKSTAGVRPMLIPSNMNRDTMYSYSTIGGKVVFNRMVYNFSEINPDKIVTNNYYEGIYNVPAFPTITSFPIENLAGSTVVELIVTKVDNKDYVSVVVYEANAANTVANVGKYGIYTFLMDHTAKTATFKFYQEVASIPLRGFLATSNYKNLFIPTANNLSFLTFSPLKEGFEVTASIPESIMHLGLDLNEKVYYVTSDYSVWDMTLSDPVNIIINREDKQLVYKNTDIESYITIAAVDVNGNYVSAVVDLTITGPAIFMGNGSTSIRETTLASGPKNVNIKIKSSGRTSIHPKLVL